MSLQATQLKCHFKYSQSDQAIIQSLGQWLTLAKLLQESGNVPVSIFWVKFKYDNCINKQGVKNLIGQTYNNKRSVDCEHVMVRYM